MIDNKMSVIQRIYWATAEADGNWPPGSQVLLYHGNGWEYWLHLVKDSVRFVLVQWINHVADVSVHTDVLQLRDYEWHEVFNWEDVVRAILKEHDLPEDV